MAVPTFTSLQTDPRQRGAAFGAAWRSGIHDSLRGYTELFAAHGASATQVRDWGAQALDRIHDWAPRLAAELDGLAVGAGLEPWQVAALNARTEILAAVRAHGEGECSTAVLSGGGPPRTMQTWDWIDTIGDGRVVWALHPRPGRVVRVFTELGVLGKVGVNSAGVGVHFNILRHASDTEPIGVPVHLIARRILDEADSVDDAVAIARSARVSASTVITVVSWDGSHSAVRALELCPQGLAEVPPGADGVLLHTNHFLDRGLATGDRVTTATGTSHGRLARLRERVAALDTADPVARAQAMVGHEPGAAVCSHPDPAVPAHERHASLLTIGLDLAATALEFHEGGPCQVRRDTWQTF